MATDQQQQPGNQVITLFDLPSRPPLKCWSLNPWKTRLLLNYKRIPYKTEWLEYPAILPRLSPHLPPLATSSPHDAQYTIPTIILPNGNPDGVTETYIMDSLKIAHALEERYPDPPLRMDSPYLARLVNEKDGLVAPLRTAMFGNFVARVPEVLLNEASIPYWEETRTKRVGMPIKEYEALHGGQTGFEAAGRSGMKEVTAMLKEHPKGPFFEGEKVGYADFVWAGFLLFLKRGGEDLYAGAVEVSGDRSVHDALLEAVRPWAERDDH